MDSTDIVHCKFPPLSCLKSNYKTQGCSPWGRSKGLVSRATAVTPLVLRDLFFQICTAMYPATKLTRIWGGEFLALKIVALTSSSTGTRLSLLDAMARISQPTPGT